MQQPTLKDFFKTTKKRPRESNEYVPRKGIPEKQFYSPKKGEEKNIFTSPVKLTEIKSPKLSPSHRAVAKRLFSQIQQSKDGGSGSLQSSTSQDANEDGPSLPKRIPAYQRFHHLAQKTPAEISLTSKVSSASAQGKEQSKPTVDITPLPTFTSSTVLPDVVESALSQAATSSANGSLPCETETGHIGEAIKPSSSLTLPYKYKILEEIFQALETVSSIYHNRSEMITFNKLKPGIHELMRLVSFKEKHLEQILTVFPESYTVTQEKPSSKATTVMGSQKQLNHELILTINLKSTSNTSDKLSSAVISERRRIFHENLLKICHRYHEEFLSSLQPPIIIPPSKKVTRWHPKFRLDEIPDIKPSIQLPQPPETAKYNTAKDVIAKAQNILDNANPRMKKALAELLRKKNEANASQSQPQQEKCDSPSSAASASPNLPSTSAMQDNKAKARTALKGVSQSLIEKIRAREQEKAIRCMTVTPEETKEKLMMGKLPNFVKSVRNMMVADRKSALPLGVLVERLSHTNHGLNFSEVEEHVRFMAKALPSWASILKLSQGEYLKVNKEININDLLEKFNEAIKKKTEDL